MDLKAMLREITSRWKYSVSIEAKPTPHTSSVTATITARKGKRKIMNSTPLENLNNSVFLILRDIRSLAVEAKQ